MVLIFANIKYSLFRRDLLNIICRNKDEIVVVSYKQEYVENGIGNLNGQDALVVFADYNEISKEYKFYPIRKVQILQPDSPPAGQPILLKLKMDDLIGYKGSVRDNERDINNFHDEVLQDPLSPKTPEQQTRLGVPNGKFVCRITPASLNNFDQSNADHWLDMCDFLGKKTGLKKCIFFRQEIGKLDLGAKSDESILLKIVSNKAYRLIFQISIGEEAKNLEHYPQILTNDNISCHGPLVSQYQGAIRAEYVIVSKSSLASINTSMTIKVKKDNNEVVSPEISHLIFIRPPHFLKWLVISLFLAGIVIPNLKDLLSENELYYIGWGWYIDPKMWLTAIGVAAPIVGTIIAAKRLPIFS
jgi:hypothetical protein